MCYAWAQSKRSRALNIFVLGFIFTLRSQTHGETPAPAALEFPITVYVFNSAEVPHTDLSKAEALAARIFAKTRTKVTWVAGLTARRADDQATTEKWNPANLLLRIRESSTVRGKGMNPEAMGFCLSMEKNEAVVLFDAIQDRAAMLNVNRDAAAANTI